MFVSYTFGLISVSLLSSKLLILRTHINTVPTSSFVLYLPTFFLGDLAVLGAARLLLTRPTTVTGYAGCTLATFFAAALLFGAASQIGFYTETGTNMDWKVAGAFASDPDGLKTLLSGLKTVLLCAMGLMAMAAGLHGIFYRGFGAVLGGLGDPRAAFKRIASVLPSRHRYTPVKSLEITDLESACSTPSDFGYRSSEDEPRSFDEKLDYQTRQGRLLTTRLVAATLAATFLITTYVIRPSTPYNFMSITLPGLMSQMFEPQPDICQAQLALLDNDFPFPTHISSTHWRSTSNGVVKPWAPIVGQELSPLAQAYADRQVDWIPENVTTRGFFRWDKERATSYHGQVAPTMFTEPGPRSCALSAAKEKDPYYNPVSDPLKITNLDTDLIPILKGALGNGEVKIRHVVLIMMEGLREELWPLQQGSHFHEMVMAATKQYTSDDKKLDLVNERLSQLSPNIERITGTPMGFKDSQGNVLPSPEIKWKDSAKEGYGGVNVVGAYTAATMTSKSYGAIHCGTPVMSIDQFDEADTDSYQPCFPQVFHMLNEAKSNVSTGDYRDMPWKSALITSTSEEFDKQNYFDRKIGFDHWFTRKQLEHSPRFNKSDPLFSKVNYFSYPEPTILPELSDFIDETMANNQRMFLSHFTSTTHHKWDLPKGFPKYDFMPHIGRDGWRENLNKYLNTIRYHDEWMATLMQLLEDKGIADETLVVFAGDHGLSFQEDSGKEGTYLNEHLSNFRVGLTFRHPQLPRVQYEANMTTISVLPTVLDLLISSGSLNAKDTHMASDLVYDYEGQSLIRPYKKTDGDRRAWAFTVINPGGGKLGVTSADVPWRIVMPLGVVSEYRITNAVTDPMEVDGINSWSIEGLIEETRKKHGEEAAVWASEAIPIANWWVLEKQRLWRHHQLA